jgi:hypothetical protein
MAAWLLEENARLDAAMTAAISSTRSKLGNPKAQRRHLQRLIKASEYAILEMGLASSKRGKPWAFHVTDWGIYDAERKQSVTIDDRMPNRPWFECLYSAVEYEVRDQPPKLTGARIFLVSNHAAIRLAQRRNARHPSDVIWALRELWFAVRPRLSEPLDSKTYLKTLYAPPGFRSEAQRC